MSREEGKKMTKISILDMPFKHHKWFKGVKLTKRQAIEFFAEEFDHYLDKKPSAKQSNNLFEPVMYDDVIKYNSRKDKSCYKLTDSEKDYFISRREFWRNYKRQIWKDWKAETGYNDCSTVKGSYQLWVEYEIKKYLEVPEYADARNTVMPQIKEAGII